MSARVGPIIMEGEFGNVIGFGILLLHDFYIIQYFVFGNRID